MSGYSYEDDDDDLGFGVDDGLDADDALEDAYLVDPVATIGAVVQSTADAVEQRVRAQVEAEVAHAQAERQTTVVREATAAMDEKYPGWGEKVPSVADVLRNDGLRGALPTHDAQALAEHLERAYLAERERTRPSDAELNAAHWQRVKSAPGATSYADAR
jgi:hypothetical protein